jgi:hypothetical protein
LFWDRVLPRLSWISWSSCLSFLCSGITVMCYHI